MRVQGEGTAQTRLSSSGDIESATPWGVSVHEILVYVTPTRPGAKPRQLSKNQKYPPKMSSLPEGMKCLVDIIPALIRLKFEDHDLLLLKYVRDKPYESIPVGPDAPIQRIPQPWESGLDKLGLLRIINFPQFGWLNESHACVKQLLVCFHGGCLWLDNIFILMSTWFPSTLGFLKKELIQCHYLLVRSMTWALSLTWLKSKIHDIKVNSHHSRK